MENKNTNQKAKPLSGNNAKPESESVSYFVDQLAMGLGRVIPPERIVLYIRALSGLTKVQLEHGFAVALREFVPEYGQDFPAPGLIRRWAEQAPKDNPFRALLERGDKPADWEPLQPGELEAMRARANTIIDSVKAAVVEHVIERAPSSDADFEIRRQRQLDAFRRKNGMGGEA